MKDDPHQIEQLYRTVLDAMSKASEKIVEIYQNGFQTHIKSDGTPVTQADLESSRILHQELVDLGLPILSEETHKPDFETRKNWNYYWCIDPLDGTKEFIKHNGEFAINIALIHENRPVFGVICSPISKDVILGGEGFGVFLTQLDGNFKLTKVDRIEKSNSNDKVTLVISRSHDLGTPKEFIRNLENKFKNINYFSKGSALKFFDLANGNADIYARFGPTMEWDTAAGHAILRELGGEMFDYNTTKPLVYNKESLYNPEFVAYTSPILDKISPIK